MDIVAGGSSEKAPSNRVSKINELEMVQSKVARDGRNSKVECNIVEIGGTSESGGQ